MNVYEKMVYVTARDDHGVSHPHIRMRMVYRVADPFAVYFILDDDGEDVVWVLARELLANGIASEDPVGEGDVVIWNDDGMLRWIFRNGEETGHFSSAAYAIRQFLRKTYTMVPDGYEMNVVDVDSFIRSLN